MQIIKFDGNDSSTQGCASVTLEIAIRNKEYGCIKELKE